MSIDISTYSPFPLFNSTVDLSTCFTESPIVDKKSTRAIFSGRVSLYRMAVRSVILALLISASQLLNASIAGVLRR